ncbi:MAG: hypothetical protein LBT83_04595 [Tannerella sp.]|nr:hypothetical protein [Tannerella sp.]
MGSVYSDGDASSSESSFFPPVIAREPSVWVNGILYLLNEKDQTAMVAQNNTDGRELNTSGALVISPVIEYNRVQYRINAIKYGATLKEGLEHAEFVPAESLVIKSNA